MKVSRFAAAGLAVVFAMSLLTVFAQATPAQKQEPAKPAPKQQQKEILPKEIKAIIQEGLATKHGRQEISVAISDSLFFWAPGRMYAVVGFKAKNGDLGYATRVPDPTLPKNQAASAAGPADMLEARMTVSVAFFQTDETGTQKVVQEGGFAAVLQTESAGYDPNKEEWYSLGYSLPYGKYTMAILLAPLDPKKRTPDLKKVGVCYVDLALPGPEATQSSLDTTSVVFAKDIEQLAQVDNKLVVHRGYFTWGAIKVVPILDNVLTANDNLQAELFFFVLGTKAKQVSTDQPVQSSQPTYDVVVDYQVQKEDGSAVIRWNPQSYTSFFVYQALPLKRTLSIKDEKGTERTEQKNLDPGKYNLVLKITDKVSGLTGEKKIPFEVK